MFTTNAILAGLFCLFLKCKQTIEYCYQYLYANLGYQPKVSSEFQLNLTLHSSDIPFFGCGSQTDVKNRQTCISEKRQTCINRLNKNML
jgi:hypothetical protein